jgi:hypothetical protein
VANRNPFNTGAAALSGLLAGASIAVREGRHDFASEQVDVVHQLVKCVAEENNAQMVDSNSPVEGSDLLDDFSWTAKQVTGLEQSQLLLL